MKEKISIIIPCYNEETFISSILEKVRSCCQKLTIDSEIIIINDGSIDRSLQAIEQFQHQHPELALKIINHPNNKGKGACIISGIKNANSHYTLIQDADLEYDPRDYSKLLQPFIENNADVVYGSRFRSGDAHRVLFFMHTIGNKFLTLLSNIFTGLNLTDMECGYKMFRTEVLKQITLNEQRFGFEPEVTAKISSIKNIRIYEVGISYHGRTYKEGKKINWKDGIAALFCIIKYNIFKRN